MIKTAVDDVGLLVFYLQSLMQFAEVLGKPINAHLRIMNVFYACKGGKISQARRARNCARWMGLPPLKYGRRTCLGQFSVGILGKAGLGFMTFRDGGEA